MPFWILAAGLFILPLSNVIIIEPILSIIHNTRETTALIICLIFITYVNNFNDVRQRSINKSLSALVLFLIFSINASPKIELLYYNYNIGNLWEWKAYAIALIYYLFYLSFSHIDLSLDNKKKLCKVIGLTAIISSIYAIFQVLGLDQSQSVRPMSQIGQPSVPHITAMIGNPTYLGVYLVACLPFVWTYFKKIWTIPVIASVILCRSDTAYAGLALMFIIWVFSISNRSNRVGFSMMLVICLIGLSAFTMIKGGIADNGRFGTWRHALHEFYEPSDRMKIKHGMSNAQIEEIKKLNSKKHVMTGYGMGSFPLLLKDNSFDSAHNVYLEVLICTGIIGLLLFLSTIGESFFTFFKRKNKDKIEFLIFISFIFLLLASFLHSTMLVEPLRFLMAFLFCLL